MQHYVTIAGLSVSIILVGVLVVRFVFPLLKCLYERFAERIKSNRCLECNSTLIADARLLPQKAQSHSLSSAEEEIDKLRQQLGEKISSFAEVMPVLGPPNRRRPATLFACEQLIYSNLSANYDIAFERVVGDEKREGVRLRLITKEVNPTREP